MPAGGGGGSPTSPTPVAQPFNQTQTGTVSAFGTVRHPLAIPRSGNMTLRLTWSDAAVDLDLYLSQAGCMQLYPLNNCGILAASDGSAGTQETILRTVSVGESFQIWIDNIHLTRPQNYTLTINIQ